MHCIIILEHCFNGETLLNFLVRTTMLPLDNLAGDILTILGNSAWGGIGVIISSSLSILAILLASRSQPRQMSGRSTLYKKKSFFCGECPISPHFIEHMPHFIEHMPHFPPFSHYSLGYEWMLALYCAALVGCSQPLCPRALGHRDPRLLCLPPYPLHSLS